MKHRMFSVFLVLLAMAIVLLCAVLPRMISEYEDRSIENQIYSQSIQNLSMTVMSPSPFAKLYLSSSRMSVVAVPENRAVHTEEEIAAIALEYFSRYQEAGLIGPTFTVSDYECNFRIHAAEGYNYFWHITMYCRTDVYGNDTGDVPYLILTLTMDDETGKVYGLYYAETTNMERVIPAAGNAEVVGILLELYDADLGLSEIVDFDPAEIMQSYMDTYCDIMFPVTDKAAFDDGTQAEQVKSEMSMVYIECYAASHSYYIDITPAAVK